MIYSKGKDLLCFKNNTWIPFVGPKNLLAVNFARITAFFKTTG
jgi:hypothetical protein